MANKVKVPVIMQMEAVECGAASLCMVLAYYKKWMPLPEVRTEMGVSRDGVSALHILKTARKYGLEAKGYRYQAEKLEEKVTLPCILFWRGEHFVVLTGFSKKGFHLNDPATGPRLVPKEQWHCTHFYPHGGFRSFREAGKRPRFCKKAADRCRCRHCLYLSGRSRFGILWHCATPHFTGVY